MKTLSRDSLFFRIAVGVALVQFLALLGVGFVFKGLFDRELRREITAHLEIPARLMARGELDAEAIANLPAMEHILGEELALGLIVDDTGHIYRSLETNHVGQNALRIGLVSQEHFQTALRTAQLVSFHEAGAECLLSILPITDTRGYAPDRYLLLKVDTRRLDARAERIMAGFIAGAVTLFILTSAILVVLHRRNLQRPLAETQAAVGRLEQGDFTARVDSRKVGPEFAQLAEGINRLADKLEHSDLRAQLSEKKFETLVENLADAIYLHDEAGRIEAVNAQACRLLGYSREELLGMNVADIVVGRDLKSLQLAFREIGRGQPRQHESVHRARDGRHIPVEIRANGLVIEGRPMVLTIARDITDRKRSSDALDQSRRQLQLIADNIPSLIAYIGRDERYIFVNKAYARQHQRFDRDIMGRKMSEVLSAEAYRTARPHLRATLAGRTEVFQSTWLDSHGKRRTLLETFVPHRENGEIVGFFSLVHDITELERASEALRLSEARFRQLVENSPYSIHQIDPAGQIGDINAAGLRMLNVKDRFQLSGLRFIDMVSLRDRDRVAGLLERGRAGQPAEFEYTSAQGQHIAASLVPLTDADGRVADLMCISRDVTEAKRFENRLRFTQLTVDQARIAVFWCHQDGMFHFVNQTACDWLQYRREELAAMHIADINPEISRADWPDRWAEIKEKGSMILRSIHRRKDGSTYPVEIHSNYVRFEGEDFNLSFVLDISAEHEARDELRESEERYRALFDNSADAIFLVDIEEPQVGRIVSANRAAAEMHGYTLDELLEKNIDDLDTPESAARAPGRIRDLIERGTLHFEVEHRRKDRSVFPMDVTASIVTLKDHKYILAVNRDITQRRLTEEIRARADREVKQHLANVQALSSRLETIREEERKRISREIHDELGQMLTVLKMNLHGIEQQVVRIDDETIRNPLEERVVEADALADETIKSVRELAMRVRPSVLDELGLIPAIKQECRLFSEKAALDCRILTDEAFPDLDDALNTTLFRLCQEFLTNIARHAGAKHVTVELAEDAGAVVLIVSDDGRGFPPGPTDRPGHLGLVGARERVSALGGTLDIESRPGQGATVRVRIPLSPTEQADL